jgi:hypothetical protein
MIQTIHDPRTTARRVKKTKCEMGLHYVECAQFDSHICVTRSYFVSIGSTLRKSKFKGSTFLHPALESIVVRVEKRFLSRSNAYN